MADITQMMITNSRFALSRMPSTKLVQLKEAWISIGGTTESYLRKKRPSSIPRIREYIFAIMLVWNRLNTMDDMMRAGILPKADLRGDMTAALKSSSSATPVASPTLMTAMKMLE